MSLSEKLSSYWRTIQGELFPWLEESLGSLTESHKRLVVVLEVANIGAFVRHWHGLPGRPTAERASLARAFVAKAVWNLPTTEALIDRLQVDKPLRRLCGYGRVGAVPSASTFSRAFAEFAASQLPTKVHEAVIAATQKERLIGHVSRDSTAIEGREKPARHAAPTVEEKPARKRGRPKKGKERLPGPTRIERQSGMTLNEMLDDLPTACDVGTKCNAKGYKVSWIGYKLHLDVADGGIPISCVLTSASVHDSQVAIPLATLTAMRVTSLYDLMDSAYDVAAIKEHSRSLGHVPIIDENPRSTKGRKEEIAAEAKARHLLNHPSAEDIRYHERTTAERANARIKDDLGGDTVRVQGAAKVMCHLMFGVLVLTVEQVMRLVT
ncbi:MAG: transposase [Alphaproteobacteria bacterium]|nr:transposase [Alphaproteobacteria bacterium]